MPDKPENVGTRLFVGGLLYSVSKADIKSFFASAGEVRDVYLAMNRERPSENRGFCFVEMVFPEDAEHAIRIFHNRAGPGGRKIGVRLANVGEVS